MIWAGGGDRRSAAGRGLFQAHAATLAEALRPVADQFHTRPVEGLDHLGQGVDDPAHRPLARLHPLDGGERHTGKLGQLTLVDAEQGAGCAHLLVEAVLPGGLAHRDGRSAAGMVVHRVGRRRAAGLTVRAVQRRLLQATPERSVALALVPAAAASCESEGRGGVGDTAAPDESRADAAPPQGRPKTKPKKRKKRRGAKAATT